MAPYNKTISSNSPQALPATDIDSYINKSAKKGADIVANPSSVLAGLPKPSIIQTAMAGLQGGLAYNPPAGASPLMAGLGGLVGGYQGAQQAEISALEMAPFEQVAPQLANEFPMLAGMPSKMATDLLKTLSGYFSAQAKPQAKVFGAEDLSTIMTQLTKVKGYTPENAAEVAQTLIGQPWAALSNIPSKERAARRLMSYTAKENAFGIPTRLMGYDEITKSETKLENETAKEITKNLVGISQGKRTLDIMYNKFDEITKGDRNKDTGLASGALADSISKGEYYPTTLRADMDDKEISGLQQRIVGLFTKARLQPGLTTRDEQRLKALGDAIAANIPKIARGLGHTGVLTELDVLKSFGITPDITGTRIENKERRAIANEIVRGNVEELIKQFTPLEDESINMDKLYKSVGLNPASVSTQNNQGSNPYSLDEFNKFTGGQ